MTKKIDCYFPYKQILFDIPRNDVKWCCKMLEGSSLDDYNPENYHADPLLNDIRNSLEQGIEHSACNVCWKAEHKNVESWRQVEGQVPHNLKDVNLNQHPYNKKFKRLELFFDNTCDLACIYCGPWLSSKWAQENQKTKLFPTFNQVEKNNDEKTEKIIKTIENIGKHAHEHERVDLAFLGGEPFLSPQVKDGRFMRFIDAYYEHAPLSSELLLNFITNLNTPDKTFEKNLQVLLHAKQKYPNLLVHISMSLECVGKYTEMTRYGSSWNQVDKNINRWLEQDWINFNFNTAFNALTLTDAPNYIEYLINLYSKHKRKLSISPNVVYEPEGLEPSVLDKRFGVFVKKAISIVESNSECFVNDENIGWQRLVQNLNNIEQSLGNNIHKKQMLKESLAYMHVHRNINIKKNFPHLIKYLKK